jgi:ABC-2 type transport system permease protein
MTAVSFPAPATRRTLTTIVRDSAVHTWRNFIHLAREPLRLSDVTVQPILFTLLFIYVFGAGVSIPGGGSYTQFAIAGLIGLNITTSAIGTAVGLSTDLASGVIDRFRTLPQWPAAVLVGRSIADLLTAGLCTAIVLATGLVAGWRPDGTALETAGAIGIVLLFAYAMSWVCACIGIASKDAESAQNLGLILLFPLSFVSNALVPTQHMPAVLRTIADYNPVSCVTAAARQLFHNPNPSATIDAWPMQHPVLASVIWSIVLIAVAAPIATRLYRRRTAN